MPSAHPIIRPVILCGGAGTRLWPLSRQHFPKQFLKLVGDRSLLEQTVERVSGGAFAPPIIISAEEQAPLVEQQLGNGAASLEAILLEPVGRNTATAAALAAAWLGANRADELILLMPSDHVIGGQDAFLKAIRLAIPHALAGSIVTFGARPTEANTQYGYIEANADSKSADGAYPIVRFHEKPGLDRAREYLAAGTFYWNCGIFLARASTISEEMEIHTPETNRAVAAALSDAKVDGQVVRPSAEAFAQAKNISIDHAIMEKTSRGVVVPVDMEWSDVGAWDAVWRLGSKDVAGNVTRGKVSVLDSSNSLLRSEGAARIAAIGLENFCVIAVDDAILIAPLDRVSELKDLLAVVKSDDASEE